MKCVSTKFRGTTPEVERERNNTTMKKTIKTILCVAVGWGVLSGIIAWGEYAPEVHIAKEQLQDVKQGVQALKTIPKELRQACIAEKLGLLYMANGESAYSSRTKTSKREGVRFYPVLPGARYIDAKGKEQEFETAIKSKTDRHDRYWVRAKQAIYSAGPEAVFAEFSEEVTAMCLHLAKRKLSQMPQDMRAAFFAEIAGLLKGANGGSGYAGECREHIGGTDCYMTWSSPVKDATFIDANGESQSWIHFADARKAKKIYGQAWTLSRWCCYLVGKDDVLKLFRDEVEALERANDSKE